MRRKENRLYIIRFKIIVPKLKRPLNKICLLPHQIYYRKRTFGGRRGHRWIGSVRCVAHHSHISRSKNSIVSEKIVSVISQFDTTRLKFSINSTFPFESLNCTIEPYLIAKQHPLHLIFNISKIEKSVSMCCSKKTSGKTIQMFNAKLKLTCLVIL